MKRPALTEDLVPVKELRSNLSAWLKRVDETRGPVVVTHRGKAAAVLIHPAVLDELEEEREVVRKVLRGLSESAAGQLVPDADVWADVEQVIVDAELSNAGGMDTGGAG